MTRDLPRTHEPETDSSRIRGAHRSGQEGLWPLIPGLNPPPRPESLTDRQAVAKLLMPVLEKVGLDVAALEKILGRRSVTLHARPIRTRRSNGTRR